MAIAMQRSTGIPEAADELELMTGEAVGLDLRPTSFVLRAAGAIIDFIAYFGLWLFILVAISSPFLSGFLDEASAAAIRVSALVFCLVVAPTTIETMTQGKSLGKLAVGARIVRDDGGSISLRHAFIRSLTGVLEVFSTFGGIAAITALLNGRTKRTGDLLAGTYSQNERLSKITPPVYGVPLELAGWAVTADVARMPYGLSRRIAQFLHQASKLTPDARDRLSRSLAAEASVFVSPLPPANAELFLAAVAAVRREREFTGLGLQAQRLEHLRPALTDLPHGFPER
ncbi:RDD family protein [Frigoribacterium sp. CG_9.8]|uniref:RDD family protein n=1 Tax=Frigoribacterium sp. CG_9.8 TaxID=2787733 RepID=UPI001A207D5B|nr:RDD family protein [Frigoribacterium sp. CG_9.8]MBG6106780.1 putative RDD family membrane protein YckC [Frigoribacterium sp. CG_9.8]